MQFTNLHILGLLSLASLGFTSLISETASVNETAPANGTDPDAGEMTLMGGYLATCRACFLLNNGNPSYRGGPEYRCQCGDGKGGWPYSTVNLDHRMGDDDGKLVWFSGGYTRSCWNVDRLENNPDTIYAT